MRQDTASRPHVDDESLFALRSQAMRVRRLARSRLAAIGLATAGLLSVTCSSPTPPTKTIVIPPPAVTCPVAPPPVTTTNGQSALVTYGLPTVTGGVAPVPVSCVPPSGSPFNIGSTPVTCTATDAAHRTASCSFTVTVTLPPPRLGVTTILAFGDSITEGEVPVIGEFSIRPQFVEPDKSYPADLTTLLAQRYATQGASRLDAFTVGAGNTTICTTDPPRPMSSGIVVINAGCLGERAEDATTLARLNDKIATYHPDVVLLLEGVNDLDPSNPSASISAGVQGVHTLIAAAQSRGARVMVGTLLPQIAADLTHGGTPLLIAPFNALLVPVATNAGARVVDLFSDIARDLTDWISPYDGLHPTEAGYQELARVWFNSIQDAFGPPAASTVTTRGGVRQSTTDRASRVTPR
jgi:lysophospholipase L1-like esterase